MVFVRKVPGRSGAMKVQIAERRARRDVVLENIGTAHDEAELAVLMEVARARLRPGQDAFDLGLDEATARPGRASGVITGKRSALLWEVLTSAYEQLGFDVLDDGPFMELVLARLIEPTSTADSVRVLEEIGAPHAGATHLLPGAGTRGGTRLPRAGRRGLLRTRRSPRRPDSGPLRRDHPVFRGRARG